MNICREESLQRWGLSQGGGGGRKEEKRGEKRNTHIFKDHGVKENLKYVLGTLICTKLEGFFDT